MFLHLFCENFRNKNFGVYVFRFYLDALTRKISNSLINFIMDHCIVDSSQPQWQRES